LPKHAKIDCYIPALDRAVHKPEYHNGGLGFSGGGDT